MASHSSLDLREWFSCRSRLEQIKLVVPFSFFVKRALPASHSYISRQRALQLSSSNSSTPPSALQPQQGPTLFFSTTRNHSFFHVFGFLGQ